MRARIVLLPGDGIGPEVIAQARAVLEAVAAAAGDLALEFVELPVGGAALDACGTPLPDEVLAACREADAVLLGAVGGPRWDRLPGGRRPEAGLLALRKALGVYANLRPVRLPPWAARRSALRAERVARGVDLVLVRELTGGLYYGERWWQELEGDVEAVDVLRYRRSEIARVARVAFALARQRRGRVTSVDKRNVLDSSRLWFATVEELHAAEAPDLELEHLLVDSCAMQLVLDPGRFDVLVTENLFGDILSDLAAAIPGSIGLLPSASLGEPGRPGLFEPVHGSAPDLAGRDLANPVGAILSAALLLRHGLGRPREAEAVERAVDAVLAEGYGTPDLQPERPVGCAELGARIAAAAARAVRAARGGAGADPAPAPAGRGAGGGAGQEG